MTPAPKLWIARLVSIPILAVLPLIASLPGLGLLHETRGDSIPIFGLLGFFGGLVAAIVLARRTLFARKDSSASDCFKIIATLAVVEAAVFSLVIVLARILPST